MRWRATIAYGLLAASCHGNNDGAAGSVCTPACSDGLVCRYRACVGPPAACATNVDCAGDQYCDATAMECLPWGVGPGGTSDRSCEGTPVPGVAFPTVQCAWGGPPAGDPFPEHANVLATPMVATFEAQGTPSIVFPAYNSTDRTSDACIGTNPAYYAVIRVIDGRTCQQQATLPVPTVVGSAPVAIADLGGADATPEIVAARSQGGLVAFTHKPSGWEVLWETTSTFADGLCDWSGPAIHDLDDDGLPEVIFYGAVYNGQTGATIDESVAATTDSLGVGYIPVVADVDGDGVPELLTGAELYTWDKLNRHWVVKRGLPGANGEIAVGDFGTFPASGQDDRSQLDGIAEIVVVYQGVVHVYTITGREVFMADVRGLAGPAGQGGPPVIADFDGDGRAEIGLAGATAYNVFDLDCRGTPDPATCASMSISGVLWTSPLQGSGANLPGSSAFDFDGDGRAEVVDVDECFTRVRDGMTGKVLASHARTSCTWYENPVIADTDGDQNAELVIATNRNCSIACPEVDPMFNGAACLDDTDCPSATRCGRDQRSDMLGRCRCVQDPDCGDGYVCTDPLAGPVPGGKVCRASHPAAGIAGVQVLADTADRWVGARPIWNQHAYAVTNIDPTGKIPRTSEWLRNWSQVGLNNFRQNAHSATAIAHSRPDLTVKQAKITCDVTAPTVSAEVCNRGSEAVAAGVPVAIYASTIPSKLRCQAQTSAPLPPGMCTTVSCSWIGASGDGIVVVDDGGTGSGIARECREDNNTLAVHVSCP